MARPRAARPHRRALDTARRAVTIALALSAIAVLGAAPAGATVARGASSLEARTLAATGIARVRGVPDVLVLTMGVRSRGDSVGAALERNNATARRIIDVLTDGGVAKDDIQTSRFSIGPVYTDRTTIEGYEVSNLVTVQLRDLDRAGKLVDRAAEAGGDDAVVQGVAFDFDDTSALVAQARGEAVRRARTQAEQLAEAAGVELGEVRTITESSRDEGPVLSTPEAAARDAAVPIEPGTEELTVVVHVVFAIR